MNKNSKKTTNNADKY